MERHIAHDCPRARPDTNCLTPKISTRLKARIHQRNGRSYRLCRGRPSPAVVWAVDERVSWLNPQEPT